jgi:threonine/homoserine/homoserine lactone efflux protein
MLSFVLLGASYGFAAAVQPGQFQAYLISETLAHGWRRTVPVAFAPILSDLPVVVLVLLVLATVPPLFVSVLQVVGGVFVLYLAAGALKTSRDERPASAPTAAPVHLTVFRAALVNVLNPNPYIAWALVLGPVVLKAWRETPSHGLAFVVAFYTTMVLAAIAIVVVFDAARALGPRVVRALVGVSAIALGGFGAYQIWSGVTALVHGVR